MNNICGVGGCNRKHQARGMCHMHYKRWSKRGTTDSNTPTLRERVINKSRLNMKTNCWEWVGARNKFGYGKLSVSNAMIGAHRAAWIAFHGDIPTGMRVCHKCDNPPCVNPHHLFIGTAGDNNRDCQSKGRRPVRKGIAHHKAKLCEDDVRTIRSRYANGGETYASIARDYPVSESLIGMVIRKSLWGHIDLQTCEDC